MNVLEKDIEDLVHEAILTKPRDLFDRGLTIFSLRSGGGAVFRQYNLGAYGIIDLAIVSYNREHKRFDIDLLELKKDDINYETLDQILKYCKGISEIIFDYYNCNYKITLHLIGKSIDLNKNFCYISEYLSDLKIYTYRIDLYKGVIFHRERDYKVKGAVSTPLGKETIKSLRQVVKSQIRRSYED